VGWESVVQLHQALPLQQHMKAYLTKFLQLVNLMQMVTWIGPGLSAGLMLECSLSHGALFATNETMKLFSGARQVNR
jgi:hypothetical protein